MELKPGYKQTEIGVIPADWSVKAIRSIAEIIGGGTPSTSVTEYWNGKIHWVSAGDISNSNGRYVQETAYHISELGLKSCSASMMPISTTVIIARGATVGRMAQLGNEMTFNQTCYGLRPTSELDQDYLYYSMLFSINSIKALTYGSIFGTITTNSFEQWKIPLPPFSEQRAIAAALSDVDALLAALDTLIAKKRLVKQGEMQELLTGKRRLLGFSGEWKPKKLWEVLILRYGKGQQGIVVDGGKYPIIATSGEVGRTDQYLYDKPSVIIGRKGTIDIPQYIDTPFWTIDTAYYSEISAQGHPKFLFYLLTTINWYSYNEASGVPSLNASTVGNIEISLPSIPEQTAIAEILSEMDAEIAALEARREKTRLLKEGMMQELLTGRIRLI